MRAENFSFSFFDLPIEKVLEAHPVTLIRFDFSFLSFSFSLSLLPLLAVSPVSALLVGALLGFLWFNAHPARVFMGDMGSHAIGAIAAGAYVLYADVWLLPLAAVIPVAAVLSVVIQVVSFRTRGKRVFRMAPIHHHFEQLGWSEPTVVIRFWIIALVLALAGLSTLKLR